VPAIAALGIFLAGAAFGALLTVIAFSSETRKIKDIPEVPAGRTDGPLTDGAQRERESDGRDAA
jgi:hypothetical protein